MPTPIQVRNISTVLTDEQLRPMLAAIEKQVLRDVCGIWGNRACNIRLVNPQAPWTPEAWRFVVADTSDQAGAAGYHEDEGITPIGYAFVKSTLDANMLPSVTISHEILEMIGDPMIDSWVLWRDLPDALFLCQELCDPVEDDALGYQIDGVQVSDFVTPQYFVPTAPGPFDFMKRLTAPNTLASGGYQLTWDPKHGEQQVFAEGKAAGRAAANFGQQFARRARRGFLSKRRTALART